MILDTNCLPAYADGNKQAFPLLERANETAVPVIDLVPGVSRIVW